MKNSATLMLYTKADVLITVRKSTNGMFVLFNFVITNLFYLVGVFKFVIFLIEK